MNLISTTIHRQNAAHSLVAIPVLPCCLARSSLVLPNNTSKPKNIGNTRLLLAAITRITRLTKCTE